jgi:alpha-L-glutamate ligase-like protein
MFFPFGSYVRPSALKKKGILGMNARNYDVIASNNQRRLYPLVDDKAQTKRLASEIGISTPHLIGMIEHQYEVSHFVSLIQNWKQFVIKPAHGSGGKGVLVIKEWKDNCFTTASGRELSFNEVYQHISNVLSGLFSLGGQYDVALLEEMVNFSDIFKDFSYQGVPDVRIIVYKGFPIMSMMRLATAESGGRANLHQGAVGVGIDIRTGKTLKAVMHNLPISVHPDTGADLMKLEVPFWREHLMIASQAFEMTGLGYLGADIVLDKKFGPMMLELNARPGLAIQIANGRGLAEVIDRVEKTYPKDLSAAQRVDFVLNQRF